MTVGSIVSVPGARPIVELGVGNTNTPAGQAVWDTARWDTEPHRWAGTEPTWLDITCDVHDVEIDQGRDRSIVRWQVGTASITLDNRDGRYDINVTPTPPAVLSVRPGRQIRVGVALDGGEPHWLVPRVDRRRQPDLRPRPTGRRRTVLHRRQRDGRQSRLGQGRRPRGRGVGDGDGEDEPGVGRRRLAAALQGHPRLRNHPARHHDGRQSGRPARRRRRLGGRCRVR